MTNKLNVAKNWKVLSAAIFLTAMLVVGSGSFQGVIAQTNSTTGNDGTAGSSNVNSQVAPNATLKSTFIIAKSNFVQAGVGLRNVGSGTISVHVPTGAVVVKALLYWTMLDGGSFTTPTTAGLNVVYLDGEKITGTRIASAGSPCWGSPNIYVYRADVTSTLVARGGPIGDQYVSVTSTTADGSSPWPPTSVMQRAESAHLIVVYQDPNEPTTSTTKIFDAIKSPGTITFSGGSAAFTAPFVGGGHVAGTTARVGYALADGQSFGVPEPSGKTFTWTSNPSGTTTVLATGNIYGKDPSITSKAAFQGSLSDTAEYDVTPNTPGGDTSGTLTWNFGGDCLSTVYVAVTG